MRRIFYILTALFVSVNACFSQSIEGKVKDTDDHPIPYVTVILQKMDSTFVDAAITDSLGYFKIDNAFTPYRLIFQHLTYEKVVKEGSDRELGTVVMANNDNLLNEIVVKGEAPDMRSTNDGLTFNIKNISRKKAIGNAYESILELPGIIERNDQLSLLGSNDVTFLLNGKLSTMNTEQMISYLKNTPISKIERIDIIYNAPAKYRVKGSAVNIIMKKGSAVDESLQVELNGNYMQKYYPNSTGNVNMSYTHNKWSFDLSYGVDYLKDRVSLDILSDHLFQGEIHKINQRNAGYNMKLAHNIRFGSEYKLSENSHIDLSYIGSLSPKIHRKQESTGNLVTALNDKNLKEYLHNVNMNLTMGKGFSVGVDYTYYKSPSVQDFSNTDQSGESVSFISKATQVINRYKLYVGNTHTLDDKFSLNYGGEFTYAEDKSDQMYDNEDYQGLNINSQVKEYMYKIYAGGEVKFNPQLSLSLSLPFEYYKLGDYEKFSVDPTFQFTYIPAAQHTLQLSLSSYKTYPTYWEMQDMVNFLNGYTELHGNSLLKPARNYSTQLLYLLKNKYMINAYYNWIDHYIMQVPFQQRDQLKLIYQSLNFDRNSKLGISFVVPFTLIPVVQSRLVLDVSYNHIKCDDLHSIRFNNKKWASYVQLDNTIRISSQPDITAELSAAYMSPFIEGVYNMTSIWKLNAGLKWTSKNKKLELRLKGNDLFNTFVPLATIHYDTQAIVNDIHPDSRNISFSISYKFNGSIKKAARVIDKSRFGF